MTAMKKSFICGVFVCLSTVLHAQVTIGRCVALAQENYPLVKKYDLLRHTEGIELSDICKSWLPQIVVSGQVTFQNVVPSFPEALSDVLDRMGTEMSGLGKLQYKVGLDLSQPIWDGGVAKAQREAARASHAERHAVLATQLYAIRERVESIFFGVLLADEQIRQTQATLRLLQSNLERMKSMKANGTAMQSDVDMVEAQCLEMLQQLIRVQSVTRDYRRLIGMFTAMDMQNALFEKPLAEMPGDMAVNRPELELFEAQTQANEARRSSIMSGLMPKVGLFAQAYYGYPGFDYFKSMMNRDMSFNMVAGVKVSWSIGAFYMKKNNERKLQIASENISADRDVFLFNTRLQTQSQTGRISELEDIMKEDSRIVELRANVRRAAEAQLENGVIDATALLSKITDENQARLASAYHEIQFIQSIYQLKYTLNR